MTGHLLKWTLGLGLALLGARSLTACAPAGEGDAVGDFCQRVDDCNALPAGTSVGDCEDDLGACVESLSGDDEADWRTAMADCLEYQGCSTLIDCWAYEVPYC